MNYSNGSPYRRLASPLSGQPRPLGYASEQVISLISLQLEWPRFWEICAKTLARHDYGESTIELYRRALHGFYRYAQAQPAAIDAAHIRSYIHSLTAKHYSWSWIGMNISVLRTVFDKLGGKAIVTRVSTPKRPERLPEILSPTEVRAILAAATTTRDQLLLGLLYGCGLKVGELCHLTWSDVDVSEQTLRVRYARNTRERMLPLPPELLPVLTLGKSRCPAEDYLFQGRTQGTPLCSRSVQLILRDAVNATDTLKTVTCMTLRHSFAVHCIERGESIRALQEALGHDSINTTLRYQDCILPPEVTSPLDTLRQSQTPANPQHPRTQNPERKTQNIDSTAPLFDPPPSLDALDLPFQDSSFLLPSSSCPSGMPAEATNAMKAKAGKSGQPSQTRNAERETQNAAPTPAHTFYELLKTHVVGRFLCQRRPDHTRSVRIQRSP